MIPEIWTWDTFYPHNSPKTQNFKKMEKMQRYIITLHKCTKNHDHMLHFSWDMARDRCNCCFSFWATFCPFTLLTAQKIRIFEKWKKAWRYHHFIHVYQKLWSVVTRFLRFGAWRTDGRTDRRTEKVTYRGGCSI